MTAPVFGATDVLTLGADWEVQSVSPTSAGTRVPVAGGDGDYVAENTHNVIENGTAVYKYIGSESDFVDALEAVGANAGSIVAVSYIITGAAIDFSPCAAGERPQVTFTYRSGRAAVTPFVYTTDLTTLLTYVDANVIVPEILEVTAGDAEIQTSNWGMTCQYGQDLDKVGEDLAGQAYQGEETINLTFVGTPTSITSTGWQETSAPGAGTGEQAANTGYGTTSYTFVRLVTRVTTTTA